MRYFTIIALLSTLSFSASASDPGLEVAMLDMELDRILRSDDITEDMLKKIPKLILASETRERFLEEIDGLQRYIVVNKSSYMLTVVDHASTAWRTKVVIGKPKTPTPEFSDTLKSIVLDPYWNVPASLMKSYVVPKITKKLSAAATQGYHYVDRKTGVQSRIASLPVNTTKYRIRQAPGAYNALGYVKYMFPASGRNIYLHDTPERYLFSRTNRERSSGCIRMENPFVLAEYLLNKTSKEIQQLRTGKEKWIRIPDPIKVFVIDWPTWADKDGNITYEK